MSVQRQAKATAAAAQASGGSDLAELQAIIDKHPKEGWRKRAILNIQEYLRAAHSGKPPGLVASGCKCTTGGHHIFCRKNEKPREQDKVVKNKLLAKLREIAVRCKVRARVRAAGEHERQPFHSRLPFSFADPD
jgi:hypothetical protein